VTAPAWTVVLDAATTRLVRRYKGQRPADVVARAMRLLAQADGLLDAIGNLKPKGGQR
jgi:hypothetical protein